MLLFRSEGHIERWCEAKGLPRGGSMSLETGWQLGRIWYGDKVAPGWHRRTADEAEATFASLGLTGDAWRLRP